MYDRNYFGIAMVEAGEADACLTVPIPSMMMPSSQLLKSGYS